MEVKTLTVIFVSRRIFFLAIVESHQQLLYRIKFSSDSFMMIALIYGEYGVFYCWIYINASHILIFWSSRTPYALLSSMAWPKFNVG